MPDVIIPVLNEAAALPGLLAAMPAGYRPLVIDNGSTDGSGQIARASGAVVADNGSTDGSGDIARAAGATVVSEPVPGFGSACWAGLLAADPADGVVCFMDGDGSLDPGDLPAVAGPVLAGRADLVLGARRPTTPGAWPAHARAANALVAFELRRRTGRPLTDLGPRRAVRRDALLALGLQDRRFGWPLEMVLRAAAAGWRIEEVPTPYAPRTGRSKVTGTLRGTVRASRDMARLLV